MQIRTAQVRLICDSEAEAKAAISALVNAVGYSRVAITAPRKGRDKTGDNNPPWLAYGTYMFDAAELGAQLGAAGAAPAARSAAGAPAATGATQRLALPVGVRNRSVVRWTRASVERWLEHHSPIWRTAERGGKKGIVQGRTKLEHDLSWQACGVTWREVARFLGAL